MGYTHPNQENPIRGDSTKEARMLYPQESYYADFFSQSDILHQQE
jgi:hypothetical protein